MSRVVVTALALLCAMAIAQELYELGAAWPVYVDVVALAGLVALVARQP